VYLAGLVIVGIGLGQVIAFWRDWLALGLWPQVSFRVAAPNPTAAVTNFVWPLLVAELVETRRRWLKLLAGIALGAAAVVMLYTSSRGGWLGMAAGVLILGVRYRRAVWGLGRRVLAHPAWRALVVVGGVVGVGVVAAVVARQWQHSSHGGTLAQARGPFWDVAWDEFLRSPLTGRGLFTFASAYFPVASVPPGLIYNQAHGLVFNLLAETGLIGLAAFGYAGLRLARTLRLSARNASGDEAWQAAAVAGLGATLVHGMFETPYVNPPVMALIALMAAMVSPVVGRGWRNGLLLIPVAALGLWGIWAYHPLHRGIELGDAGDWEGAARQFDEATRRDPLSTWARLQAAYAAHRAGRPARAIELYQAALPREPGYSLNWANLAAAQWAVGDPSAALDSLARARSLAPQAELYAATEQAWRGQPRSLPIDSSGELRGQPESHTPTDADLLDARIAQAAGGRLEVRALEAERALLAAAFEDRQATDTQVLQLADLEVARGEVARAEYLLSYAMAMRGDDALRLDFVRGDLAAARGDLSAAARHYALAWRALSQPDTYGPGTNYAWLVFVRESLRANVAPGLRAPPHPPAVVERLRTLMSWYHALGESDRARELEVHTAGWDR
jgi:tetratricopeptide (TPR) repeat protein